MHRGGRQEATSKSELYQLSQGGTTWKRKGSWLEPSAERGPGRKGARGGRADKRVSKQGHPSFPPLYPWPPLTLTVGGLLRMRRI